ncbi:MAG: class I SAM-dependent methyltransferase [Candidatus Binataceae bacterium]
MLRSFKKSLKLWSKRIEVARSDPARRWAGGIDYELDFWEQWCATKGLEWPDEYRRRIAADTPLQPELAELLGPLPDLELRILDIGAGPLTIIGKTMTGHRLSITATDALGEDYARMLERHAIEPIVRTLKCRGEELITRFPPDHFHLAYAQNSLDHTIDPLSIIRDALRLARPGGYVVLLHQFREGERALYDGLHQWNFDEKDGRPLLWRPGTRFDLKRELAPMSEVSSQRAGAHLRIVLKRRG